MRLSTQFPVRLPAWKRLSLAASALIAFAALAFPSAHADVIYLEKAAFPELTEVAGWTPVQGDVVREIDQPEGKPPAKVTFLGVRGRIVDMTLGPNDYLVHFQVLLEKNPGPRAPRGGDKVLRYTYDRNVLVIPRKQIQEIEEDFDGLYDLRMLLGNDDVRLREMASKDPRMMTGAFSRATPAQIVKLMSGTDDWVYAMSGYGGALGESLISHRLGLKGITWAALERGASGTRYDPGWLTFLLRKGIPPNDAKRNEAIKAGLERGEVIPAVARIPLFSNFGLPEDIDPRAKDPNFGVPRFKLPGGPGGSGGAPARPAPVRPRAARRLPSELVLGADLRPVLHRLMLGAARDDRFKGIVLNSEDPEGRKTHRTYPFYMHSVIKIMQVFCSWSQLPDAADPRQRAVIRRARAVGHLARQVVIECLEAAGAGRASLFDAVNGVPGGRSVGRSDRLNPEGYLPIDPSRTALVAMRVIQGSKDWQTPDSAEEARRLVKVLVRLARPRYGSDAEWTRDPRSLDFGRAFPIKGNTDETYLTQEALTTLGGAARQGLLVATPIRGGKWVPSPYVEYMVGILNELDPRDRMILMTAMTMAGVGNADQYKSVVDRMFAICLDQQGWETSVDRDWVRQSRRDAVATLGLLVRIEKDLGSLMAGKDSGNPLLDKAGKTPRMGGGSVSKMIFLKLDALLDAKNKKVASEQELGMIEMLKKMTENTASRDPRASWLPSISRGLHLARGLTNSYHEHVENAPAAIALDGSRRVESMKAAVEEPASVDAEIERVKSEIADAKERFAAFPFPARPQDE